TADWIFVDDGRVLSRWSNSEGDARRAMASGADGAADALTRRYAKHSPAGPPGKYRVTFTGINNGADYVRLSALLQGMSVVRGITPLRATPQGLEVDLELLTGLPGFRRMVDEDVLLEVGAPPEGETLPGQVAAPAVFQLL